MIKGSKNNRTLKTCSFCNTLKSLDKFCNHKAFKDGKQAQCKSCQQQQYNVAKVLKKRLIKK
jgi:hypothetical protein